MIKRLPYLPGIFPSSSSAYNIYVEDFMVRDVFYIWYGMTYSELKRALKQGSSEQPIRKNAFQPILIIGRLGRADN